MSIPILFLASQQDTFVNSKHAEALFKNYFGENKKILYFQGDHNEPRPKCMF